MSNPKLHEDKLNPAAPKLTYDKKLSMAFDTEVASGLVIATYQSVTASIDHVTAIAEHFEEREDKREEIIKLCENYELYSMNLDGSMLEILQKAQELLSKDGHFLEEEIQCHGEDVVAMSAKLEEMRKKLQDQIKDG